MKLLVVIASLGVAFASSQFVTGLQQSRPGLLLAAGGSGSDPPTEPSGGIKFPTKLTPKSIGTDPPTPPIRAAKPQQKPRRT